MHRCFSNAEEILRRLVLKMMMKLIVSYGMKDRLCNYSKLDKSNNRLHIYKIDTENLILSIDLNI